MMLPMFPILFLVTAVGSVFWYLRTANDIFGVLAAGSALVCLIWGLVHVHWAVHLLSLLLLLKFSSPIMELIQVNANDQ